MPQVVLAFGDRGEQICPLPSYVEILVLAGLNIADCIPHGAMQLRPHTRKHICNSFVGAMRRSRKLKDSAVSRRNDKKPSTKLWDPMIRRVQHGERWCIFAPRLFIDFLDLTEQELKALVLAGVCKAFDILEHEDAGERFLNDANIGVQRLRSRVFKTT